MKESDFEKAREYLMNLMKKADEIFIRFGKIDNYTFSDGPIPKKYKKLTSVCCITCFEI